MVDPVNYIFANSLVMPKPSSMKRLKRTDQISLGAELHFIFHSFSSKAIYVCIYTRIYVYVNMGATFVSIIKPNICWKYLPSNTIRLLFKTKSSSSMMKWALSMTFWKSKQSFLMLFIASLTGMFVYKLLKSIVNKKQFFQNDWFPKV